VTIQQPLDDTISKWLEEDTPGPLPDRVLRTTFERTRRSRQHLGWRSSVKRWHMNRMFAAVGGVAIIVVAIAGVGLSSGQRGVGGVPATASPSATTVPSPIGTGGPTSTPFHVTSRTGTALGWSRDGSRLLIERNDGDLFLVHADGFETHVTDQMMGLTGLMDADPATGATLSPDGSRVVFAGLTKRADQARNCHDGALFAIAADGGPAEVLFKSRVPQNGIVRNPVFSPDGTHIAFADGYCDYNHSVWIMNSDGSDPRQILTAGPLAEAGHVRNLAWSAAGDRLALTYGSPETGGSYTFATDGSDIQELSDASNYCWPGWVWLSPDACSR
jgi:WD40 repeat protein